MIVFRKNKIPSVLYRKKPFKIAAIIVIPTVLFAGTIIGIYFLVNYINASKIKYEFNVNDVKDGEMYSKIIVPKLDEDTIKQILINQFEENQTEKIISSYDQISIKKNNEESSATDGIVVFHASFTISNQEFISNKFKVFGFKKQPRPLKMPDDLYLSNTPLTTVYPFELTKRNEGLELDKTSPQYQNLKFFLYNSLGNKPENFTIDYFNFEIKKTSPNSTPSVDAWEGTMFIQYWLNSEIYNSPYFSFSTRVHGFKKYNLTELTPNESGIIEINAPSSYHEKKPSGISEDEIKQILVNKLIEKDMSIPLRNSDISISINKVDDVNGMISLKYININTYFPPKTYSNIVINGFKSIEITLKNSIISAGDFSNVYANEIRTNQLQELIFQNIEYPADFDISPWDIIINVKKVDNINGKIELVPNIKGFIKNPINQIVLIEGFKIARPNPFQEKEYSVPREFSNLKPTDVDDELLKKIVFSLMTNVPSDLKYSDITIDTKNADNELKSISVSGSIPKYAQKDPFNFSITIVGFK